MSEYGPTGKYFAERLKEDPKRRILWSALWDFSLSKVLRGSDTILELGAGWCDFINIAQAKEKIAVDLWPGIINAAEPTVKTHISSVEKLSFLEDSSVDAVFASNLVEHLTQSQFDNMLTECNRVMVSGAKMILLQPNFRFSFKRYFDDFTHVSIWTDTSLRDFLLSRGWEIERVHPKYMPLSVKSKLPVFRWLILVYLSLPFKPISGQMLVIARKP
jgi:ubiquinone/menaquinone biosynthesis C-methylase UbiE